MTQKIVITKLGYDGLAETDPNNLIFSSDYNTLKYFVSGNVDITINGDGTDKSSETTVAHNLGYKPLFVVYVDDFVNGLGYYITPYANSTITVLREAHSWADDNNLYLKMRNKSSDNYTAHFYYKIFRNRLEM